MATIPPIQLGAAKITFPANLPKNEKDLICMILAGRLKDLLNGRLVCVQLAIDDLIRDMTGISALNSLAQALGSLKGGLDALKALSGADAMLSNINLALNQIENVFSLGGMCPTPVHAPKIPDVLGALNNALFGQTMGILNSLGKVMNPSMCLGAGPGGIGINWNSLEGSLKELKKKIDQLKSNPGMYQNIINAFEQNLKSQQRRLNTEIKRLKNNITDPFGVNKAKQKANNIVSSKGKSDGYPVIGSDGVERPNVTTSILTPDLKCVAENGDTTIVRVETKPVLDYCGDIVGFEIVSTAPGYEGWSTEPDALNQDTLYTLPIAQYNCYDFNFIEKEGLVFVYDSNGKILNEINISRGKFYRFGFHNITGIKFFSDENCTQEFYYDGIEYNKESEYGLGFDSIIPDDDSTIYSNGFIDWSVLIQKNNERLPNNPGVFDVPLLATPNVLYWKNISSDQVGVINVNGATEISYKDRAFDVAEAVRKAILHIDTTVDDIPVEVDVTQNYSITAVANINGITTTSTVETVSNQSYFISTDNTGDKIIKSVQDFNGNKLTVVRVVDDASGLMFKKIYIFVSPNGTEELATFMFAINMTNFIDVPATTKLPIEDIYDYSGVIKDGSTTVPIARASEKSTFTLIQQGEKYYLRWNLTSFSETNKSGMKNYDMVLQTDIEIEYNDLSGSFTRTNPKQSRVYMYIKLPNNSYLSLDMTAI